ncbi:MAG: hypothetical protein ACKVZH_14685 [Blastocatellia bacterium]
MAATFLFIGKPAAFAQSYEFAMTIQVPFDFQVGESQLPAGKYTVQRNAQMTNLLLIQSEGRKISVYTHTFPHGQSGNTGLGSLTFTKYGEKHFLSRAKLPGIENGYALAKSKAERQQRHLAEAKIINVTPNVIATNN